MDKENKKYKKKLQRAYEVKKQVVEDEVAAIKNIRDVEIPILEAQLAFLVNNKLLDHNSEQTRQLIGSIAVFAKIIEAKQNNIKFIIDLHKDESVEIENYVQIEDLASKVNMPEEISKIFKVDAGNTTALEFTNKDIVVSQIAAAGVRSVPTLRSFRITDNRDFSGNFLMCFLGIISIFVGCWMLEVFGGIFAISFATSLIFGGISDIISSLYHTIKDEPIDMKEYLKSKGMSLGIALATAGVLHFLSEIPAFHSTVEKIAQRMAETGKDIGSAFAIQAASMLFTGLLYDIGRRTIDTGDIKRMAREAIDKIIKDLKEKLRKIFATDFFNDNDSLIRILYNKIGDAVDGYMGRFKGEGAVFGKGVTTNVASTLLSGGVPFLGNIIGAGTDFVMNSIKDTEALDDISEKTVNAILEIEQGALTTGEMMSKRLEKDYGKSISDEIMVAMNDQNYIVNKEIDYNNCEKFNSLDLRSELSETKVGIVGECGYIQTIMTEDYEDDYRIFGDHFVEDVAQLKNSIQKEMVETVVSLPGGALGNVFGKKIYNFISEKLENFGDEEEATEEKKRKTKKDQFPRDGKEGGDESKLKSKPKAKPESEPKPNPESDTEKDTKKETSPRPDAQTPKDADDKQSKGYCVDGVCFQSNSEFIDHLWEENLNEYIGTEWEYEDSLLKYDFDNRQEVPRQYNTAADLAKAMGPNSVAVGLRPLVGTNFIYTNDKLSELNLKFCHSQFFWTDSDSKLHDRGFFETGILPDDEFLHPNSDDNNKIPKDVIKPRYDLYKFVLIKHDVPYTDDQAKMQEILEGTTGGKPYNKVTNNCHYSIRRNPLLNINIKYKNGDKK